MGRRPNKENERYIMRARLDRYYAAANLILTLDNHRLLQSVGQLTAFDVTTLDGAFYRYNRATKLEKEALSGR